MSDVYIGKGKLFGKGVYAARDFQPGEVVKYYHLKKITAADYEKLPPVERRCIHTFWGEMYLFPEPSRYTNHSANPNTISDLERMCDIAVRPIKKGEMITTNATQETLNELRTFFEHLENQSLIDFKRIQGGYRNAIVAYRLKNGIQKTAKLKRIDGNWKITA